MGTRCLTFVYDEDGSALINMYRQYDGYPSGHGMELAEFLAGKTLVNGIPSGVDESTLANGMGCLAAQMVAHFKQAIGNHYLVDPDTQQDSWQEYEYHVFADRVEVYACYDPKKMIFSGSYKALLKWAKNPPKVHGEYVVTTLAPKTVTYTDLDSALQGATVQVTFRKADDSIRVMKCTKDANIIPEDALNRIVNGHKAKAPKGLYRVWDIEKQDWRSFKEERLVSWKVV